MVNHSTLPGVDTLNKILIRMKIRRIITLMLTLCACAMQAWSVNPYPQLEQRAQRFFTYEEWASAAAMFDLMLEQRPDIPSTYGQAIVANAMRGNTSEQIRLMSLALDHHVPFDSVFSRVRQWSYHLGKADIYENFLTLNREAHPWMRRTIDAQLLKYYTFRRNGPEMITYSQRMLAGAPDNIGFLYTLASGQLLTGKSSEGIATLLRILSLDPDNYDTLVMLGNWYAEHPSPSISPLTYLNHAYSLRPTPYVASLIESLR